MDLAGVGGETSKVIDHNLYISLKYQHRSVYKDRGWLIDFLKQKSMFFWSNGECELHFG